MVHLSDSQNLSLQRQEVRKLTSFISLEIEATERNRYYETTITMPSDVKRITGIRIHSNFYVSFGGEQRGSASLYFDHQNVFHQPVLIQAKPVFEGLKVKIKPFVFEPCQHPAPRIVKLSYYDDSDEASNPYRVQCTIRYEKEQ